METARIPYWGAAIILALSACLLSGLAAVPFHPDESTYLFMSSDLRDWLTNPLSLAYDPARPDDVRQNYRLLDSPLTRYLLGVGLALARLQPPDQDWDWTTTWEVNEQAGALPSEDQLLVGRLAVALTLPLSLIFIYLCGKSLGGERAGAMAALLLALNALVLLHARRAMAEGALLLGTSAFLASLPYASRRPWLAGLTFGLAFNAKYSALALLPAGLLAVAWSAHGSRLTGRRIIIGLGQFLLAFGLLTLLLNPVFWARPFHTAQAAMDARRQLLAQQVADVGRALPQHRLETPGERAVVLLAHLYLAPPMFAEAGNYRATTAPAEASYLADPLHRLGRDLPGAGLMFGLTVLGLIAAGRQARQAGAGRRSAALFLAATLFQSAGLVLAVPLAWQRYVIPLVPLACLWASLGIAWLLDILLQLGRHLVGRSLNTVEM